MCNSKSTRPCDLCKQTPVRYCTINHTAKHWNIVKLKTHRKIISSKLTKWSYSYHNCCTFLSQCKVWFKVAYYQCWNECLIEKKRTEGSKRENKIILVMVYTIPWTRIWVNLFQKIHRVTWFAFQRLSCCIIPTIWLKSQKVST